MRRSRGVDRVLGGKKEEDRSVFYAFLKRNMTVKSCVELAGKITLLSLVPITPMSSTER